MSSLFHWEQIKEESECTHTTKKQLESSLYYQVIYSNHNDVCIGKSIKALYWNEN